MIKTHYKKLFYIILALVLISGYITFLNFSPNIYLKENIKNDFGIYSHATGLVITNTDGVLESCLEYDKTKDACFIRTAKLVFEKDYNAGLKICEMINDAGWKSECFFTIAESLFDKNISMAIEICKNSGIFKYNCYHHFGRFAGKHFNNIQLAVSACEKIPFEFRGSCFAGISAFFIDYPNGDVNLGVSVCNKVPVEFKDDCFKGLGDSAVLLSGGNVSSAISACEKVPVEFRGNCFIGICGAIGYHFSNDIRYAISACEKVPVEFKKNCLTQLSISKGCVSSDDSSCSEFESPYNLICFLNFGKKEGMTHSELVEIRCDSIGDKNFKALCYRGFGRGLGEYYFDNTSFAFKTCGALNESDMLNCFKGISESVGDLFLDTNHFLIIDKCYKLNALGLSSYCFERIGEKIVKIYNQNLSKAFNTCYKLNESFRNSCFIGVGKELGEQFLYNPSLASMKCDELLEPYNTYCDQGLNYTLSMYL